MDFRSNSANHSSTIKAHSGINRRLSALLVFAGSLSASLSAHVAIDYLLRPLDCDRGNDLPVLYPVQNFISPIFARRLLLKHFFYFRHCSHSYVAQRFRRWQPQKWLWFFSCLAELPELHAVGRPNHLSLHSAERVFDLVWRDSRELLSPDLAPLIDGIGLNKARKEFGLVNRPHTFVQRLNPRPFQPVGIPSRAGLECIFLH